MEHRSARRVAIEVSFPKIPGGGVRDGIPILCLVGAAILAVVGGPVPAEAQLVARYSNAGPVAGFYSGDDQSEHAVVVERTSDGSVVHDVRMASSGVWRGFDTVIGRFSRRVVGIAGFDTPDTQRTHVVVGMRNGIVYALDYQDPSAVSPVELARYSAKIVAVTGFRTADGFRHAVVALDDGSIHDVATHPLRIFPRRDTVVASFPRFGAGGDSFGAPAPPKGTKVVAIAGMGGRIRDERRIVVALRSGEVRALDFAELSSVPTEATLAKFRSRVTILSAFPDGVLVGLADGSLHHLEEGFGLVVDTVLYSPGNPLRIVGASAYEAPIPSNPAAAGGQALVPTELEPRFLISTLDGLVSRHFFDGFGPAAP